MSVILPGLQATGHKAGVSEIPDEFQERLVSSGLAMLTKPSYKPGACCEALGGAGSLQQFVWLRCREIREALGIGE